MVKTAEGIEGGTIEIFDITGRQVAMLHADHGRAMWEAWGLSSGVYFARVIKGQTGASATQVSNIIKLILMK
ncbi:MAG: hypothetical protein A2W25_01790 [candidate division Zixibacteria bacterium RBG_16_53_22]|nr:MAG: hypothetical protein A2W25_01790 [candidate division Zixibacteria bacterium RBG_16_53_22]